MRYRIFATAATFIGSLIGAGFASGREIALYFGHTSVFVPLLSGMCLGASCYFFLKAGRLTSGNPSALWGKGAFVAEFVVKISNAVTFCAMIAGSEEVIFSLFGFHGGGIISAVLSLIVVLAGVEKIKFVNFLLVPLIILTVAVLFFQSPALPPEEKFVILPSFTYAAMNVVGGGYFVSTMSGDFTEKECVATSVISGVVLTALLVAVYCIIRYDLSSSMPVLVAAKRAGMEKFGDIVVYLAIFTTLTGSLAVSAGKGKIKPVVITALATLASQAGFALIVNTLYPVLGTAGAVVTLLYLFFYFRKKIAKKEGVSPPSVSLFSTRLKRLSLREKLFSRCRSRASR